MTHLFSLVTVLLLAGALAIAPAAPAGRIRAARRRPKTPRDGPPDPGAATDIALFAACCEAGLSAAASAAAVADTHADAVSPWHTVAALSALGAEPERAWQDMREIPGGAELASLVCLSNSSGAALADGARRIAEKLVEDAAHEATARAERAGVLIAIPLTAFFLPAFFVLGLAPVLISLAAELTH